MYIPIVNIEKENDLENHFNSIQYGPFRGCSRMKGAKGPPFLKSVAHILQ